MRAYAAELRCSTGGPGFQAFKPGLHCDISISTSINISITNVHTCYISTRKVTYASAVSSRMNPWEYGTRHVFKMAEDEFSCCFCCSADARYLFTHNFLISAAFVSETCECSLTSTNTKDFCFICNLEII